MSRASAAPPATRRAPKINAAATPSGIARPGWRKRAARRMSARCCRSVTRPVTPTEPVLYSFRRCPYAMRARMALAVSGTPHEIREVKLREKPAAMLVASPKGTVPVLVLADGRVIDESLDIMRWALAQNDPE